MFRIKRGVIERDALWVVPGTENMSISHIRRPLTDSLVERWQNRWNESENGRISYRFIPGVGFVGDNTYFILNMQLDFIIKRIFA